MIVDCHGHYNSQKGFTYYAERYSTDEWAKRIKTPFIQALTRAEEATTAQSWIESLDRYGVDKVLLQTAPFGDNDAVAEFVSKAPDRFVGIANIDFIDPEGSKSVKEVVRAKDLGLKGIGELYPPIGPWDPADKKCFPIYEKAQELGLPIMIHLCSESFPAPYVNLRYNDPYMLDTVLRNFPDLMFIFCHMGGDYVHHLYVLMKARMNVYAEISSISWGGVPSPYHGFFNISRKSVLEKFLGMRLGSQRLLWGTDVQAPYNSDMEKDNVHGTIKDNPLVKLMEELNLNEEDKANILGENARKVFKL